MSLQISKKDKKILVEENTRILEEEIFAKKQLYKFEYVFTLELKTGEQVVVRMKATKNNVTQEQIQDFLNNFRYTKVLQVEVTETKKRIYKRTKTPGSFLSSSLSKDDSFAFVDDQEIRDCYVRALFGEKEEE